MKNQVIKARDEQGRPIDVLFVGDAASQCPGCLSKNVESWGALGFLPAGDRISDDNFSPISRMVCRDCGGRWVRPGI